MKKKNGSVRAKIVLDPIFYEKSLCVRAGLGGAMKEMIIPVLTVCLLLDPEWKHVVARGISIRSLLDQFRRKKGRDKSYGRAIQAYINGKDSLPIKPDRFEYQTVQFGGIDFNGKELLERALAIGTCKSMYYPTSLTIEESQLLKAYRDRKEAKKIHVDQGPDHPKT